MTRKLKRRKVKDNNEEEQEAKTKTPVEFPGEIDQEDIQAAFAGAAEREDASGGTSIPYMKWDDKETVRFLPSVDPDNPLLPYFFVKQHSQWKGIDSLDLNFVYQDERLMALAEEFNRLTDEDRELWQIHGDPYTKAGDILDGIELPDDVKEPFLWPVKKWYYQVARIEDGEVEGVYFYACGKERQEQLRSFVEEEVNLFSVEDGSNIISKSNGKEGLKRRYTWMVDPSGPSTVEIDPEDVLDLREIVAFRIIGFRKKAQQLFKHHGKALSIAGVSLEDFLG